MLFRFRTTGEYLLPLDLKRHALKPSAGAWPPDTLARFRLVGGAVIGADKKSLIFGKKLVIQPIQREGDMAAAIEIGMQTTFVTDQKCFNADSAAAKRKFLALTVGEFTNLADELSLGFSFVHGGIPASHHSAKKDKSPSGQPTKISPRST